MARDRESLVDVDGISGGRGLESERVGMRVVCDVASNHGSVVRCVAMNRKPMHHQSPFFPFSFLFVPRRNSNRGGSDWAEGLIIIIQMGMTLVAPA